MARRGTTVPLKREKGLHERRAREKSASREADEKALASGTATRAQLQCENALFAGWTVRIEFENARSLC